MSAFISGVVSSAAFRMAKAGAAETTAWLSWFLNAHVGWPEFADRVAQVGAWALPRIPAEARRPLLVRTLRHARDDQAWRVFAAAVRAARVRAVLQRETVIAPIDTASNPVRMLEPRS